MAGTAARVRSAHFEVFRRLLAAVADDLILHGLPLVEGGQARALDSRDMDEHVLAAALRLDKAVTLGRVEPLHGSGSHRGSLLASHVRVSRSRGLRAIRQIRVLGDDLRAAENGSLARQTENLAHGIYKRPANRSMIVSSRRTRAKNFDVSRDCRLSTRGGREQNRICCATCW